MIFFKIEYIMISVPGDYGILEKTELKQSIEKAKLNLLRIVSEPVANILSINYSKKSTEHDSLPKNAQRILIDMKSSNLEI
jgi:molecular chaperone DnaK (HSP70)